MDILIKNGKVIDGTGNPWFKSDVAIAGGKIVAVEPAIDQSARLVIDAAGKFVSPGFIDAHSHDDLVFFQGPYCLPKLTQGVTSTIIGNCGIGAAPTNPQTVGLLKQYSAPVLGDCSRDWDWPSYVGYMGDLADCPKALNVGCLVAHGSLRIAVMGFSSQAANAFQLVEMKRLLNQGLAAGALGLSLGIMYAPGCFATSREFIELAQVVAQHHGVLTVHLRSEAANLLAALNEVADIARETQVTAHISHLKIVGKENRGKIGMALEFLENSRRQGVDITCDVYPYTYGSTTASILLPPWVLEGGIEVTLDRLSDSGIRARVLAEFDQDWGRFDNLVQLVGWENVIISDVQTSQNAGLVGSNLAEVAAERHMNPAENFIGLFLEEQGQISILLHHIDEADMLKVLNAPFAAVASDGIPLLQGNPHPRLYGTFARLLGHFSRDKQYIGLEQAIRKITSLPAQRFNLHDRGLLKENYAADITIFDGERIADRATYTSPRLTATGIDYVITGGAVAYCNGQPGNLNGKVLRRLW